MDWNFPTLKILGCTNVTPCVGVWIETLDTACKTSISWSHPAWVCGLKRWRRWPLCADWTVTPCVGVWIETRMDHCSCSDYGVTPCVGVWIETIFNWNDKPLHKSHPAWVCGLKLLFNRVHNNDKAVTPCVGVWIETISAELENRAKSGHTLRGCVDWNWRLRAGTDCIPRSHPAWVCGLKHLPYTGLVRFPSSHPAWVCGLKPIEEVMRKQLRKSHPAWVCGLKHDTIDPLFSKVKSHPAWVCGLKQERWHLSNHANSSHPAWVCGLKLYPLWTPSV